VEATVLDLLRDGTTGAVVGALCRHSKGHYYPGEVSEGHVLFGFLRTLSDTLRSSTHLSPSSPTGVPPNSGRKSPATDHRRSHGSGASRWLMPTFTGPAMHMVFWELVHQF
jgi:hypothetical protein